MNTFNIICRVVCAIFLALTSHAAFSAAPITPVGNTPGTTSGPGPTQTSANVRLSWSAVSAASYYAVGVRDLATNVLVISTTTNTSSYVAALQSGKPYRWNVAACNSSGCSGYTTALYFRTAATVITHTLNVSSSGTGAGTITSNPGGITCGSVCSASYPSGSSVTLTAVASNGSSFSGWSGACSGAGSCVVSVTAARAVTATFAAQTGFSITQIPGLMDLKGWKQGSDFMRHWFEGTGDKIALNWSDVSWMRSELVDAKRTWENSADTGQLLNQTIRNNLTHELRNTSGAAGAVLIHGGSWDHISSELENAGSGWISYEDEKNYVGSNMHWVAEKSIGSELDALDSYKAAFGKATLRLLTAGNVAVNDQTGTATVTVTHVGTYLKDSYDFIDDQLLPQFLGFWGASSPYAGSLWFYGSTGIYNSTFRDFNTTNGYPAGHGDFRVFTKPETHGVDLTKQTSQFTYKLTAAEMSQRAQASSLSGGLVDRFYSQYTTYFGTKQGGEVACYGQFVCQDFQSGKKIAVIVSTRQVWFYEGQWYYFGVL